MPRSSRTSSRSRAEELKALFREKGYPFLLDSPTNQQFIILEKAKMAELQEHVSFSFWENLDRLLANMGDAELNTWMMALTKEKEALKAKIAEVRQVEVSAEEQAARRQQMWESLQERTEGYTEFDEELVRQFIQKVTVENAETIRVHFRDSDVVLEQGLQ